MKRSMLCRCALCLLLSVMLLPFSAIRAEETDMHLVTVNAESLFEDQFHLTELLLAGDQYYIRPEEAGELAGLKLDTELPGLVYRGQYEDLLVSVAPYNIQTVSYNGSLYYALEPYMEQLQVYLCERDGILLFNSVQHNLDRLLVELNNIVLSSRFDADHLRDIPTIGGISYYVAKTYQAISNFDFNPISSYKEDIRSRLTELLSPEEKDLEDIFRSLFMEKIQSANKKLNKAAKYILSAEDEYEKLQELLYDIPAGGDILLFGIDGTRYLRESLEAVRAANKEFLSDFFLRNYFSYAEMSDYEDAMKELDLKELGLDKVNANVNMYSISDLITLAKYYADIVALDEIYIKALDNVLEERVFPTSINPDDTVHRQIIYDVADQMVTDYKIHINGNLLNVYASLEEHFLEVVAENAVEDILTKPFEKLRIKVKAGVTLATFLVDCLGKTKTTGKMNALTTMYEYKHIQDMIYDSLKKKIANPKPENAEQYINMTILYLKCTWLAINAFSTSNLPKDGIPAEIERTPIEESLGSLLDFASFEFQVAEPEHIPGGSLTEQSATGYLISNSSLSPYISVYYADHHSFATDWEGTIECSYDVPMVNETLECSSGINKKIFSLFHNYVSGSSGKSTIHGEKIYEFYSPMSTDEFLEDCYYDPTILKELSWEANIYADILSIRIHRNIFNPESLSNTYYDEYDVFNIDLQSGQLMDSEDVLFRLGISQDQIMQLTINELDRIFGAGIYLIDEPEEQWNMTLQHNKYSDLLERGLYISPQGIQVWAEIVSGSIYIEKEMLTLLPDALIGLTAINVGSALPDDYEDESLQQAGYGTDAVMVYDDEIVPFFVMRTSEFRQKLNALFEEFPQYKDIQDLPYRTYKSFPLVPKFDYASKRPFIEILQVVRSGIEEPAEGQTDFYAYYYDLDKDLFYDYSSVDYDILDFDSEECKIIQYWYSESESALYNVICTWDKGNYDYTWCYHPADDTISIDISSSRDNYYAFFTYSNSDGMLIEDECYISSPD